MTSSNIVLCTPLQQLRYEHVLLRADMDLFYEIIEDIEMASNHEVIKLFLKLYQQVSSFTVKLEAHSKREETGLFPIMTRHLGENNRTISDMESEHTKAEQHLHDFLFEAKNVGTSIDEDDVQWMTVYAFQAHATLTQHFAKEERVLFPLAENILSIYEKKELEQLFNVL